MDEQQYQRGDQVEVTLPGGTFQGAVMKVLPNYSWTDRTWYDVRGKGFQTITTARSIRPC